MAIPLYALIILAGTAIGFATICLIALYEAKLVTAITTCEG